MKKSLGIVRNKNLLLSELRNNQKQKDIFRSLPQGSRFSRERLGGDRHEIEMVTIDTSSTMKKPFIQDLSTVNTIESPKPTWILHFEKCQTLLRGVEDLRKEMLVNQNKRLSCVKVSEQKGYQLRIYDCAKQATSLIKMCQNLLEDIKHEAQFEAPVHAKVCQTASNRLAFDIQEATKQLRLQQKSFIEQRKQFEVTEKASFLDLAVEDAFNMGGGFEQDLIQDQAMRDLEQRNQEIKHIVQSIYQLNDIYKQVHSLVVIQGSLLDRIDANIESAHFTIEKGLQHLESANKKQKRGSRCACKAMVVLFLANIILLIILCCKWF